MASEEKLERLLNLTAALVDASRPLSAADIQQRVAGYASGKEAFRRTFERDKDELRALGVPIELRPVPGTFPEEQGYWVDRDRYELPDPDLTVEELAALRLALGAIGSSDPDRTIAGTLRRLGGVVVTDDPDLAPDTSVLADLDIDPHVGSLFGAVIDHRVVEFAYRSGDGRSERRVEPWSLGMRRGHWYLEGHDIDRDAPRQFRLDRIDGALTIGEPDGFEPPSVIQPPSDRAPWRYGGDEAIEATLRVAPDVRRFVADALGPRAVESVEPDGSSTFVVEVTNVAGFRSFVLGLLDDAEILGPPSLREDLAEWLRSIAGAER